MLVAAAASLLLISGCSLKHATGNVVAGKELFVAKCGACHTLRRAGTTTDIGPNLDDAFAQDRADGVKSASIEGLVNYWIQYPDTEGVMPADLYKGQQAQNVAAYVAAVAAVPGVDTGQLAQAGAVTGTTAAAGKQVFTGPGGCGSCHTLAAAGTTGTVRAEPRRAPPVRTARSRRPRPRAARRLRSASAPRSSIRTSTSRPATGRT